MKLNGEYIPVKYRAFIKSDGFDVAIKEWIAKRTALTHQRPTLDYAKSVWGAFRITKLVNADIIMVCESGRLFAPPDHIERKIKRRRHADTIIE